jgi:hypothetical protein
LRRDSTRDHANVMQCSLCFFRVGKGAAMRSPTRSGAADGAGEVDVILFCVESNGKCEVCHDMSLPSDFR